MSNVSGTRASTMSAGVVREGALGKNTWNPAINLDSVNCVAGTSVCKKPVRFSCFSSKVSSPLLVLLERDLLVYQKAVQEEVWC